MKNYGHVLIVLLLVSAFPYLGTYSSEPIIPKNEDQQVISKANSVIDKFEEISQSKTAILDLIRDGKLPDEYSGRYMAMSSSQKSLGDEFLPPLNLGKYYLHFVSNTGIRDLKESIYNPDVQNIILDKKVSGLDVSNTPQASTNYFQDISNTQRVNKELNVTGRDIILGITDTGIDFGNSELSSAMYRLPSGISASFDATGSGLAMTSLDVKSEVLDGITFLPLEGKSVNFWGAEQQSFINSTSVGIQLKNLEISGIAKSKSGVYKFGIAYVPFFGETQISNYFIFILVDTVNPTFYDTLYVDMDTSFGISLALNDIIFESGNLYRELVDWSLNDEIAYNSDNPVIAYDWNGDGANDFSLGALATTLDLNGIIDQGLVSGIHNLGLGFAFMSDAVGHGTMTASAAAGRGNIQYPLYDDPKTEKVENATLFSIPGSAPDAMIIATKGYQLLDFFIGWLWIAGLEPTLTGWTVNRDHVVDISSNSWGDGSHTTQLKSVDFFSLFLDALSTPNIFDLIGAVFEVQYTDYPGITFVVSMGNGGPGFGTIASPGAASLAFTVGASTSFHPFGMNQRDDVALFSGVGPTPLGYVKPDAVALGSFGFVVQPVAAARGNGTYSSRVFGGTSEAGPRAAGIIALLYESMRSENINPDLGKARTILKSTARDLGFDPVFQGAGLLDAYSAVVAVKGGSQIIIEDRSSPKIIGQRLNNAFNLLFDTDHPSVNNPFPDASILVEPQSLKAGLEFDLVYANGSQIDLSKIQAGMYSLEEKNITRFSFSTRSNFNQSIVSPNVISQSTSLVEIITSLSNESYEQLLSIGLEAPEIRLVNEENDYYIAEAYTTAYSTVIYAGFPYNDFSSDFGLLVKDPGYVQGITGWKPLKYTSLIRQYEKVDWGLGEIVNSFGKFYLEGNLTEQDYKVGYIQFKSSNGTSAMIPLAYAPRLNVGFLDKANFLGDQEDDSAFYELDEALPSWNWLGSTARPESGDHRFYYLSVPDNATYLAISVNWSNNPFLPNLFLYDTNGSFLSTSDVKYLGSGLYEGSTSTEDTQNLLIKTKGGDYVLEIHVTETPFTSEPVEMKVFARYLTISDIPNPDPVFSQDINDVVSGELEIDSSNYSVFQFPELEISNTRLDVFQEFNTTLRRTISQDDIVPGSESPELQINKTFVQGEKVDLLLNWTSEGYSDLDIKIIYNGEDVLLGSGTTPGLSEEHVSFGAKETGKYLILIDYINGSISSDIEVKLSIDSRKGPYFKEDSAKLSLDTNLFPNQLYLFQITLGTNFGISFTLEYIVFLINHSPFEVSVSAPSENQLLSGEVTFNWMAPEDVRTSISMTVQGVNYSLVTELKSNTYTIDTTNYPNGLAELYFIFTDGFSTVRVKVNVEISNSETSSLPPLTVSTSTRPIPVEIYGILLAILFLRRKTKAT